MKDDQAIDTSASDGLEGFKAHAVFQEIDKKLQEVFMLPTRMGLDMRFSSSVVLFVDFIVQFCLVPGLWAVLGLLPLS